jgi:hypothetical protein
MKQQKMTIAIASVLLGASLAASLPTTAGAQDRGPGRYTMHKTDDGFVRLDTETGAVSLCRKEGTSWSCRDIANAEDQTGKDADTGTPAEGGSETQALRQENKELKDEIARLEELLGLREPGAPQPPRRHSFKLPSEKDVDQAFDYFERMLRKFQDRLKRLERENAPETERQL